MRGIKRAKSTSAVLLLLFIVACSHSSGDNSPRTLVFTEPAPAATIPFNTPARLVVQYLQGGSPVPGAALALLATRGSLSVASPSVPCASVGGATAASLSVTTDSAGQASAYICTDGSSGAGGTAISATVAGGPSASLNLVFVATTPASVVIQASPSTIEHTASSTVSAVVRDALDNPVPGQQVDFTLTDPSGGSLSAASAVTDPMGSASVMYHPNPAGSSNNSTVSIDAEVDGTGIRPSAPLQITVVGTSLHMNLGTSNRLDSLDPGHYQYPFVVLVSDSAGNPPPNATVTLSAQSIAYQKGVWIACNTTQGAALPQCQAASPPAWVQVTAVPASDPHYNSPPSGQPANPLYQFPFGCLTEDPNNTGIYSQTLDYNNNGVLDPGAIASVPASVQLDSSGAGQFQVTYPKDHADWVEVLLQVSIDTTTVHTEFILPILSDDVGDPAVPPPGAASPYGKASSCADPL